jgi:hypothetical protein
MKRFARYAAAAALLLLSGACAGSKADPPPIGTRTGNSAAEAMIRAWPAGARATARAMIAEYGQPDRSTGRELRWTGNGPWAKTIVHRRAWSRFNKERTGDYLEQTVAYRVPETRVDELRRFDDRLEINGRSGQMSAWSSSEALNVLLLNLAHEIVSGRRNARSARSFVEKAVEFSKAGKSSVYMERLLFPPGPK